MKIRPLDYLREALGPSMRAAAYWITLVSSVLVGSFIAYFVSQSWFRAHYLLVPVICTTLAFLWSNLLAFSSLLDRLDSLTASLHNVTFEVLSADSGEHLAMKDPASGESYHIRVVEVWVLAKNSDGLHASSIQLVGFEINVQDGKLRSLSFLKLDHDVASERDKLLRALSPGEMRRVAISAIFCYLPHKHTTVTQVEGTVRFKDNRSKLYDVGFTANTRKN